MAVGDFEVWIKVNGSGGGFDKVAEVSSFDAAFPLASAWSAIVQAFASPGTIVEVRQAVTGVVKWRVKWVRL